MTSPVLHADFLALDPAAEPELRASLLEAAGGLAQLDGVVSVALLEAEPGSEYDLALFFVLRDFAALEPFGTDERYVRFLQGRVAPVLRGLAGADVQLDAEFPPVAAFGACVAAAAPPQTYDWEVRDWLRRWTDGLPQSEAVVGLAIGERQRFRGIAVAFGPQLPAPPDAAGTPLGATLIAGKARLL